MSEAIKPVFVSILDEANTTNCPTKSEMAMNKSELAEAVYEGRLDASEILKQLVWCSAIVEQFTEFKKVLAAAAPAAAEKYASEMRGQVLSIYGADITIKKGAPAFDFSEDTQWSEKDTEVRDLEDKLKKAKAKRAAIEKILKLDDDAKKYIMYYNDATASVTIND